MDLQDECDKLLQQSLKFNSTIALLCDKADIALNAYRNTTDLKEKKSQLKTYINLWKEKKDYLQQLMSLNERLEILGREKRECECNVTELKIDLAEVVLSCICITLDNMTPSPSPSRSPSRSSKPTPTPTPSRSPSPSRKTCPCRCITRGLRPERVEEITNNCAKLRPICVLKQCINIKRKTKGIECCHRNDDEIFED